MSTPRPEYKVIESGHGRAIHYQGDSLVTAAKLARRLAASGRVVRLKGDGDFRNRVYRPEFAQRIRWHYAVCCSKCAREMYPDGRSLTCRQCWSPRNSPSHMAAVEAMNDRKRNR